MSRQAQTTLRKPQYAGNEIASLPVDTTLVTGAGASTTLYEGDMAFWSTQPGVAPLLGGSLTAAIVANIGRFIGISGTTDPTTYWNSKRADSILVYKDGVAELYGTTSDVYHAFDEVMIGADSQTITLATPGPSCAPAGLFTAGTVSGGTLLAANYVVTAAYITSIGLTAVGTPSAAITATAGQGIVYDYDNASAFVIPSWALGVEIYLNGQYAYSIMSQATALAADLNITGINLSNPHLAPTTNCLAIGRIQPVESSKFNYVSGVTAVAGQTFKVRFKSKFPVLAAL